VPGTHPGPRHDPVKSRSRRYSPDGRRRSDRLCRGRVLPMRDAGRSLYLPSRDEPPSRPRGRPAAGVICCPVHTGRSAHGKETSPMDAQIRTIQPVHLLPTPLAAQQSISSPSGTDQFETVRQHLVSKPGPFMAGQRHHATSSHLRQHRDAERSYLFRHIVPEPGPFRAGQHRTRLNPERGRSPECDGRRGGRAGASEARAHATTDAARSTWIHIPGGAA